MRRRINRIYIPGILSLYNTLLKWTVISYNGVEGMNVLTRILIKAFEYLSKGGGRCSI
jgi:hypothetical protein